MAYGRSHPPLLIAVIAVLTSVAVEGINYTGYGYLLRNRRLNRIRSTSARLTARFARRPFLACLFVAATPVPDWSIRVLAALAGYPARRYLLAFALGRMPKFWLLATLGHVFQVSGSVLLGIVVGSVLLTFSVRWLQRRPSPSAAERRLSSIAGHAKAHPQGTPVI